MDIKDGYYWYSEYYNESDDWGDPEIVWVSILRDWKLRIEGFQDEVMVNYYDDKGTVFDDHYEMGKTGLTRVAKTVGKLIREIKFEGDGSVRV